MLQFVFDPVQPFKDDQQYSLCPMLVLLENRESISLS